MPGKWDVNFKRLLYANELPTWSVVIYIKPCKVAEPFYEEHFPTGELIHHFRHRNIKLWELRPEDIEQLGLIGLFPLIVLMEGGSDPEVIEQVISRLEETEENTSKELLSLLYLLASFVIEKEPVMQWLKRRFFEMHNELRETWVYQEILQEGQQKERRIELDKQRLMLTRVVQQRYPEIVDMARHKANSISDLEILRETLIRISLANSREEAVIILS